MKFLTKRKKSTGKTVPSLPIGAPSDAAFGTDAFYNEHKLHVLGLHQLVGSLEEGFNAWLAHTVDMVSVNIDVMSDFKQFYERYPSGKMLTFASTAVTKGNVLKEGGCAQMNAYVTDNLKVPLKEWKNQFGELKVAMSKRDAAKSKVNHYTTKLLKLEAIARQKVVAGKHSSAKEEARLARNKTKLSTAEAEFTRSNQEACMSLQNLWTTRFEVLNSLFTHTVKTQTQFIEQFSHSAIEYTAEKLPPQPRQSNSKRLVSTASSNNEVFYPVASPPVVARRGSVQNTSATLNAGVVKEEEDFFASGASNQAQNAPKEPDYFKESAKGKHSPNPFDELDAPNHVVNEVPVGESQAYDSFGVPPTVIVNPRVGRRNS